MTVTLGARVPILTAVGTRAFKFTDGDVVVEGGASTSVWSADDGLTWSTTPLNSRAAPGPGLGAGESRALYRAGSSILSFARLLAANGDWTVRSSTNDWVTVATSASNVVHGAIPYIPPGGGKVPSMIFDRGIVQLASNNLVAALYGNFAGDVTPVEGWPSAFGAMKARLVIYQSVDSGANWTNLTTLMNNLAFGRGTEPVVDPADIEVVPMVSQEGTTINDMVIAPDGTVLTFARSGARISTQEAGVMPTPIYYISASSVMNPSGSPKALSLDEENLISGDAPSAVKTSNNLVVLGITYPTTRIYVSSDNGVTFGQETTLCTDLSGTPITLLPLTSARVLAIYKDPSISGQPFIARQITVS